MGNCPSLSNSRTQSFLVAAMAAFSAAAAPWLALKCNRLEARIGQRQPVEDGAGFVLAAVIADHDLKVRQILGGEKAVPVHHHRGDAFGLVIGGRGDRQLDGGGQIAHAASSIWR